jgi:hypothetical protein
VGLTFNEFRNRKERVRERERKQSGRRTPSFFLSGRRERERERKRERDKK